MLGYVVCISKSWWNDHPNCHGCFCSRRTHWNLTVSLYLLAFSSDGWHFRVMLDDLLTFDRFARQNLHPLKTNIETYKFWIQKIIVLFKRDDFPVPSDSFSGGWCWESYFSSRKPPGTSVKAPAFLAKSCLAGSDWCSLMPWANMNERKMEKFIESCRTGKFFLGYFIHFILIQDSSQNLTWVTQKNWWFRI